uniref:Origin recognition complex subunit 5 C-terminal domain-containing protein n=1 Tax=Ditylenchus dipsaci TaxID=166011 RepID=A0A915DLE8_9BILA
MDIDKICELVAQLVKTDTNVINHIHCYGINYLAANSFISSLQDAIEVPCDPEKNQKECCASIYDCINYDGKSKDLFAAVEEEIRQLKADTQLYHAFVLSSAEEFQQFNKESLRTFIHRFKQNRSIKLITISEKPWSKIESDMLKMTLSNPIQFHIPVPKNDVLVTRISDSLSVREDFVKMIVDLVELYYAGFEILQHIVKMVAENVRSRICALCKEIKNDSAFPSGLSSQEEVSDYMDYPLHAKFLIIAAYCASYNPPVTDRRFFFSRQDILRRRKNVTVAVKDREKFHETGPKPFDHQRVLFIFLFFWHTYTDDITKKETFEIDLNSQLVNLMSVGILKMTSTPEYLDMPKYRCLCSLKFADGIARSLDKDLNIRDFLLDFAVD